MKKDLFAFIVLMLALGQVTRAQNVYSFSKTSGNTYAELTNDVMVPGFDAAGLYMIPGLQGETFKFYRKSFTIGGLKTVAIGEGPFLRVDDDSSALIIDVAFTTIDTIDATSRISYRIDGTSGSKILKVQYRNFKLHTGPAGNSVHVQIWYHQQSGVVELHYGPRTANNASGYTIQTGPNIGMFYAPDTFTSCYEKLWVHGSPNSVALDSTANLSFKAMSGVPDDGTIYRFTPRAKPLPPPTNTVDVGVSEMPEVLNVRVQPNPADTRLGVSGTTPGTSLALFDLNGKLILHQTIVSENEELNTALLPAGVYILKLSDENGRTRSQKVFVAH